MSDTTTAHEQPLSHHLLTMAYNNAWANHRLLAACSKLTQADFEQTRTSFFPSIKATLNHNLTVDWFYVDALEREARGDLPNPDSGQFFAVKEPLYNVLALQRAQADVDQRLLAYCAELRDDQLQREVVILRASGPKANTRVRLLAHVFQHQIHHRGQAHAMLAGTSVAPPPLDEFFTTGNAAERASDFAALGWTEAHVWQTR
ncbi:MAG: DinB family protein [Rhodoferax sp.]